MLSVFIISAKKLAAKIALSMISDKFIEWAFFNIAERIVKSTSTPHDDEWLAKIKEAYFEGKEG
ncbi:MAG: hypothetical protein ACRDCE_15170 [Cetobacterium sp.]|uniref:hypothetical protein n=1 Tax=Cetobacterium sp. TaxID=2071632 RepID=UPI003EE59AA5